MQRNAPPSDASRDGGYAPPDVATSPPSRRFEPAPRACAEGRLSRRRRRLRLLTTWATCIVATGTLLSVTAAAVVPAKATESASGSTGTSSNLLVGDQATYSGTTGGWVGAGATLSWVATPAAGSTGSLVLTATSAQAESAWSALPGEGRLTAAAPGRLYTATASVLSGSLPVTVADVIVFYNSAGSLLTSVWGQGTAADSSPWTSLPAVAGIAPPSTAWAVMGIVAYTSVEAQKVFVDGPDVASAPAPGSPAVVGPLHTSGNQIRDAKGRPVVLKGVVLDGLESNPSPTDVTEQSVLQAKAWGANFVRVPLGEQFWLSSNCNYVASYQSTVAQVVNWITSLGMVALLDLHYGTVDPIDTVPGAAAAGICVPGGPHNMADEAQSPTFWSQVASMFSSNPLVAFDLYNEPHDISDSEWLNGGMTVDTTTLQPYQTAGMQQLYDTVRTTGAQNLVFISGNNWANTVPATLVSGANIVYAAHVYTCPVVAPPACLNADPYDPSQILDNFVPLSSSLPVMITEFGWPSAYDGTYNASVIAFAQSHGWGWVAYSWESGNDGPFSLVDQSPASGPYQPTPAGIPVILGLAGVT